MIADALGGEIDAETYELSYNAAANDVANALEAASGTLGTVSATKTVAGEFYKEIQPCYSPRKGAFLNDQTHAMVEDVDTSMLLQRCQTQALLA